MYFIKIVLQCMLNIPKPSFMMLFSIFLRNNGSSKDHKRKFYPRFPGAQQ